MLFRSTETPADSPAGVSVAVRVALAVSVGLTLLQVGRALDERVARELRLALAEGLMVAVRALCVDSTLYSFANRLALSSDALSRLVALDVTSALGNREASF